MNRISKLAKIGKNVKLGTNNIIGDNVIIADNVIIGNNNKIYPYNNIYPNVSIGNNNVFLENNLIGEHSSSIMHKENKRFTKFINKVHTGVIIGNNNFIHRSVVIDSGIDNKTIIGDNNQLMYGTHIGDEAIITNNVYLYVRTLVCGKVIMLPYSGAGGCSAIHQRKVIGSYSFIGMLSASTKHVFPFLISIGNKYTRINSKRAPEITQNYEKELFELMEQTKRSIPDNIDDKIKQFPEEISKYLTEYFTTIKNYNN